MSAQRSGVVAERKKQLWSVPVEVQAKAASQNSVNCNASQTFWVLFLFAKQT